MPTSTRGWSRACRTRSTCWSRSPSRSADRSRVTGSALPVTHSAGLPGEHLGHGPLELLAGDVANVLGEPPAMAERVGDLPVAPAPEGLGQWLSHLGAAVERALPDGVHVVGR